MEGPRAGIHNVEQHVNQLEQRLEDCLTHKADAAEVPTNYQVRAPGPNPLPPPPRPRPHPSLPFPAFLYVPPPLQGPAMQTDIKRKMLYAINTLDHTRMLRTQCSRQATFGTHILRPPSATWIGSPLANVHVACAIMQHMY